MTHHLEEITIHEAKGLAAATLLKKKESDFVGFGIGASKPHINVYVKDERCTKNVPGEIGGFETKAIVSGILRTLPGSNMTAHQQRYRPAPGGVQIAVSTPAGGWAGTFGVLVYGPQDGRAYILTNNHVAAGANSLPIGTPIYQPNLATNNRIGTLASYVRLYPDGAPQKNEVDAALVLPDDPNFVTDEILDVGIVDRAKMPRIGMLCECAGSRGYFGQGRIIDVDATFNISGYDELVGLGGTLTFYNNIVLAPPVGEDGQSGGLVVEKHSKAGVGLLFAGSQYVTIANWLITVLDVIDHDMLSGPYIPEEELPIGSGGLWARVKPYMPHIMMGTMGLVVVGAYAGSRNKKS